MACRCVTGRCVAGWCVTGRAVAPSAERCFAFHFSGFQHGITSFPQYFPNSSRRFFGKLSIEQPGATRRFRNQSISKPYFAGFASRQYSYFSGSPVSFQPKTPEGKLLCPSRPVEHRRHGIRPENHLRHYLARTFHTEFRQFPQKTSNHCSTGANRDRNH
jgi:hypothetical protein